MLRYKSLRPSLSAKELTRDTQSGVSFFFADANQTCLKLVSVKKKNK